MFLYFLWMSGCFSLDVSGHIEMVEPSRNPAAWHFLWHFWCPYSCIISWPFRQSPASSPASEQWLRLSRNLNVNSRMLSCCYVMFGPIDHTKIITGDLLLVIWRQICKYLPKWIGWNCLCDILEPFQEQTICSSVLFPEYSEVRYRTGDK